MTPLKQVVRNSDQMPVNSIPTKYWSWKFNSLGFPEYNHMKTLFNYLIGASSELIKESFKPAEYDDSVEIDPTFNESMEYLYSFLTSFTKKLIK